MLGLITEGLGSRTQRTLITAGQQSTLSALYDRIFFCAPLASIVLLSYPCSVPVLLSGIDAIALSSYPPSDSVLLLGIDAIAELLKNPKTSARSCC